MPHRKMFRGGKDSPSELKFKEDMFAKAKAIIEHRFGVVAANQNWESCEPHGMTLEFVCRRSSKMYIAQLVPDRNVVRVYSHHKCINIQ